MLSIFANLVLRANNILANNDTVGFYETSRLTSYFKRFKSRLILEIHYGYIGGGVRMKAFGFSHIRKRIWIVVSPY